MFVFYNVKCEGETPYIAYLSYLMMAGNTMAETFCRTVNK